MTETTSELAVHMAASAHQADAAALTDSAAFMAGIEALGPDTPGFLARVSEAVGQAVAGDRVRFGASQPQAPAAEPAPTPSRYDVMRFEAKRRAELTPDYAGQITAEDVQLASPAVVNAWATAGRLAHLGVAAKQRRGR